MAEFKLVKWGFVVNEFHKSELIRSIRRHKLCDSEALAFGYAIEQYVCSDLSSVKTGKQAIWHPIYLFGQADYRDGCDIFVTGTITYISDGFGYAITINNDVFHLQGECFLDIFKRSEGYNPESQY